MKCPTCFAAATFCFLLGLGMAAPAPGQQQERRTGKTVFDRFTGLSQQRRIIINDDSSYPRADEGIEAVLDARFRNTLGTGVGAYFVCVGHSSTGSGPNAPELPARVGCMLNWWSSGQEAPAMIDKLTRAYIKAVHEADMPICASLRMNDIHDAWEADRLFYPLKLQRPDLLLGAGTRIPGDARHWRYADPEGSVVMAAFWSGFDYAKEEVRQHFLGFIRYCCRTYDFDGLELDYFRHPLFFKLGEEEQNLDTMTQFVRQVRELLDQIGRARGRPYRLVARVPDSLELARRTGLDVEEWLKGNLLDMLVVGGGYMPYAGRLKELIDLAHDHDVPAYPCINHFGSEGLKDRDPIHVRSIASNFWALGADGVYIFNYNAVPRGSEKHRCLSEMNDPDMLIGMDKQYLADSSTSWNAGSIRYLGHVNPPPQFPVRLIDGTPIELVVGDDLATATGQGILDEARLRVKVSNMDKEEGIAIKINGTSVPSEVIHRADAETFEAVVGAPPLKQGINRIVILPGRKCLGRFSSAVSELELAVRYKHGGEKGDKSD